jgi:transcriptional regulator with XRE-family HTH domain
MSDKDDQRKIVQAWIEAIMARQRIEIPSVAGRARVSASTIYRWFDQNYEFNPSLTTLRKIAKAFDVPLPDIDGLKMPPGFAETEVEPLGDRDLLQELPAAPNQGRWRITTRALELAGYLPGDLVLMDMTVAPRRGDIVCAQVYDLKGGAETKIRVYQPPFLVTQTMDPRAEDQPLYVDNERVVVVGTVIRSLRVRAD